MNAEDPSVPAPLHHLVVVRPEPPGQFTAEAVGLHEIRATCSDREEAIKRAQLALCDELISGRLVSVEIPRQNPLLQFSGWLDPNYPAEKEFLEIMACFRQEDLERTLREYEAEDQACSNSSSTPTHFGSLIGQPD
jgi:hypothetical protein